MLRRRAWQRALKVDGSVDLRTTELRAAVRTGSETGVSVGGASLVVTGFFLGDGRREWFNSFAFMNPVRRAVIDVGTNSIKLLVGEVADGIVRPVEERSEQTRLGAGFYETHELQPVPIAQTASVVARFVAVARDLEAVSVHVIATSAARDAKNASELIEAVRRASGLRVEVISGDQEAEWVYRGVTSDPVLHGRSLLILDVGGGSTEFILGNHGHHSFRQSFPLGSVRLLEKLKPDDPPSIADLAGCRDWLKKFFTEDIGLAMGPVLTEVARHDVRLVGTGGTVTILARMEKQMTDFDRSRIEGTVLSRSLVLETMVHLWSLPLSKRRKLAGLPPSRADVIIMGVAIYEAVMQHFNLPELYVSTRGLRYGALLELP
jgi:exopolyphosphatase/guanosine-5'-triphosphate,3'-diphosphate pyrophosphatase